MKVTDEMVATFKAAWEAEDDAIGFMKAEPGTRTRAGLEAVFELLEIAPRQPELDPEPWVASEPDFTRYAYPDDYQGRHGVIFAPLDGYSQNREDYT